MATRVPTLTALGGGAVKALWTGLLMNDTGEPVSLPAKTARSVHIFGTFGTAAATVQLQGRNDGSGTFTVLVDPQGNNISKAAEAIEEVLDGANTVRPVLTAGGDGATNLSVAVIFK